MPLDTRIALGVQPLQVQFRDLGADYNQLAQMRSADTQNQLAQMQMQESRQLAPLRMQEQQSRAAVSKIALDEVNEAQTYVKSVMTEAANKSGGTAPKDPFAAAKQMLSHPNAQVQAAGLRLLESAQKLQEFEDDQRYAAAKGGVAGAPTTLAAAPAAAPPMAAAPAAPPEMFVTKDSSGRPRYVVSGVEVSPQEYQSAQSGVVVGAAPAAKPIGYELPAPVNALAPAAAAAPTANVNAMAAPVAKTAADIKAEIDRGDLQFGRSKRWAKERELLVDEFKEAIKPGRADSTFAAINPSDYTPESVKAFVASKNYGDLIPKAGKTDSPISNVNPNDFTPASIQKFALSKNYGDLVLKPVIAAPRPEPAPSITNIVDPTNPNQMIAIDAKRYRGGGVGSPGVIGVGGKEPGAALRVNKVEAGKTQLADDLDNLRSSFRELDRLRAIPSTERNVASNLMSAAQATGVGQALGRAGGTKEQVERDVINSARQRLVASIKNATGMSSKSLDSNMELQTMLRSISDPGQSVEAALRIIQDIEDAYVTGDGAPPKRNRPAGDGAPAVNVDALLDKYK